MAEAARPPSPMKSRIRLKQGSLGKITILGETVPIPPSDIEAEIEWVTPPTPIIIPELKPAEIPRRLTPR